jgi:hypothetical protein
MDLTIFLRWGNKTFGKTMENIYGLLMFTRSWDTACSTAGAGSVLFGFVNATHGLGGGGAC